MNILGKCDVTVAQICQYTSNIGYPISPIGVSKIFETMIPLGINPGIAVAVLFSNEELRTGVETASLNENPYVPTDDEMESLKQYLTIMELPDDKVEFVGNFYAGIKGTESADDQPIDEGDIVIITSDNTEIHSGPSGKTPVIAKLPIGFRAWIPSVKNGWGELSYGGYIYLTNKYVTRIIPEMSDVISVCDKYEINTRYVCVSDTPVYVGQCKYYNVLTTLKAGSIISFSEIIDDELAAIKSSKGITGYICLDEYEFDEYVEPATPVKTTTNGDAPEESSELKKEEVTVDETQDTDHSDVIAKVDDSAFMIVAGRFRNKISLDNHAKKLTKAGLDVQLVNDGSTTACVVGSASNEKDANEILKTVRKKGFVASIMPR